MDITIPNPVRTLQFDRLPVEVYADAPELGIAAARQAADVLRDALIQRGEANVILACANSQLGFLDALSMMPGIDWSRIRVFHMDEYLGLSKQHPARFSLFLQRHFLHRIPTPKAFHVLDPDSAPVEKICADYAELLRQYPADLVVMGWGENGHIAFNDPPYADFQDPAWVKVIRLDEVSRRQQVGEAHFPDLDSVPTHAITLTIPALLASRHICCVVPEARKAAAVRDCLQLPVHPDRPGSILRQTPQAMLFLDRHSARLM